MGMFLKQNDNRSDLQQRLDAELRAKAAARSNQEGDGRPDGVEDAEYIKGTKQTTSLAWLWAVVFLLAVGAFILFVIRANSV